MKQMKNILARVGIGDPFYQKLIHMLYFKSYCVIIGKSNFVT